MATINNLSQRFETAVDTVSGLNSYRFGYEYDLNAVRNTRYPLCLVVGHESSVPEWVRPVEEYRITMLIMDVFNRDDDREMTELWSNLKQWGAEVIDAVAPRTQSTYIITGPVDIVVAPAFGNDNLLGARFTFTLVVKNCWT